MEGEGELTSWAESVDVDFMFGVVEGDGSGEVYDGAFGGAVGGWFFFLVRGLVLGGEGRGG